MSRNKPHLACLGDVTLDIVVRASGEVDAGTDVPAAISFRIGGSAANTARAFAGLGGRATFLGAVGDDKLGRRLVAGLRAERVTVHAPRMRGASARLVVVVGADGERSFLTDRGVADRFLARAIRASWLSRADTLHIPAYSLLAEPLAAAAEDAASKVRGLDRLVSLDLASARPLLAAGRSAARQLVSRVTPDVLFGNTQEVAALVGPRGEAELLDLAPLVVVKLGADGCRVLSRDARVVDVATRRVVAADTTGAGDAFDAGFLHALIGGGYSPGWWRFVCCAAGSRACRPSRGDARADRTAGGAVAVSGQPHSAQVPHLVVAPEVRSALNGGGAVVALESTLITHGLAWPRNLEAAQMAEAAVRAGGAVPATVVVHDGSLLVGLSEGELSNVARATNLRKASRATLAVALNEGGWAGTTVSATMIAADLAGIRVFATGGIGGVHRGGADSFDISADLEELARTPVLVVCAGPKSVLDVDLTLEYLETRGVPLVGWGTRELAGFFARESGRTLASSVSSGAEAADLASVHWRIGLSTGLLVAVPVPPDAALSRAEAETAIAQAVADSEAASIHGPAATPWILARVAEFTAGRSVAANLALIENNARVAAEIAVALAALGGA